MAHGKEVQRLTNAQNSQNLAEVLSALIGAHRLIGKSIMHFLKQIGAHWCLMNEDNCNGTYSGQLFPEPKKFQVNSKLVADIGHFLRQFVPFVKIDWTKAAISSTVNSL